VEVVNAPAEWFASDPWMRIGENEVIEPRLDVAGGPAALSKVIVWVNIAHPWDGDLVLTLVSPNGISVRLAFHEGGQGDDFRDTVFSDAAPIPIGQGSAPFTGTYIPAAPLSQLAGWNANGTWILRVEDEYAPWYPFEPAHGGGTLMRWALHLE
jgi:subtilisin-like proprotein convertase family protein